MNSNANSLTISAFWNIVLVRWFSLLVSASASFLKMAESINVTKVLIHEDPTLSYYNEKYLKQDSKS